MAKNTPLSIRSLVIYEIYVRSHSPQGNFAGVTADLYRIKALGVDVIWLMPIHPIGRVQRKGSLGSPYSIADYYSVNPEYGSQDDFKHLIGSAHALNLKVMIDVVYHHTAHDSAIMREHPNWYHTDAAGRPISNVPEWSDVIDLDFSHADLRRYLIGALEHWARLGVDGFRCDVASIVPLDFWLKARAAIKKIDPACIWLAESVEARWVADRRAHSLPAWSDSELHQAFDITYDYDVFDSWEKVVKGEMDLHFYLDMLRLQDCIYPANFAKLRFVENHDKERIMAAAPSHNQALAWTAFQAFNKGPWLIYSGQESAEAHRPSLFDKEPIQWGDYLLSDLIHRLAAIRKDPAAAGGELVWARVEPAVAGIWYSPAGSLAGIFNVSGNSGIMEVNLPDGNFIDLLSDRPINIQGGKMALPENVAIFACDLPEIPSGYPTLLF